jgi:D-tyrosyl-tRNA(Tyr) deacylase
MKAVIQRVSKASVEISEQIVGEIDTGLVILIGIHKFDQEADAAYLAKKIARLRIFEDGQHKMNINLLENGGKALVISQFTLYANTRKGRRPSFIEAAEPDIAIPLYLHFIHCLENEGVKVERGEFGAQMMVKIFNQGPVTIVIYSEDRLKPRRQ